MISATEPATVIKTEIDPGKVGIEGEDDEARKQRVRRILAAIRTDKAERTAAAYAGRAPRLMAWHQQSAAWPDLAYEAKKVVKAEAEGKKGTPMISRLRAGKIVHMLLYPE